MQNKHFNKFAQDNEKAELKSKYCNIKERIMNIELSVKRNHLKTANLQRIKRTRVWWGKLVETEIKKEI